MGASISQEPDRSAPDWSLSLARPCRRCSRTLMACWAVWEPPPWQRTLQHREQRCSQAGAARRQLLPFSRRQCKACHQRGIQGQKRGSSCTRLPLLACLFYQHEHLAPAGSGGGAAAAMRRRKGPAFNAARRHPAGNCCLTYLPSAAWGLGPPCWEEAGAPWGDRSTCVTGAC